MDLLIGTSNPGKLNELRELLAGVPLRLFDLRAVGLAQLNVEETGDTLEDNARLKSQAYAQASGMLTMADDTGLYIDALGGAPGIYPARYGGPELTMADRRQKVLRELSGVPDEQRTARFVAVIALTDPLRGETMVVRGECPGRIAQEERLGEHGFGYDPIFVPDGHELPFSLLTPDVKNQISHRARAAQRIRPILAALAAEG